MILGKRKNNQAISFMEPYSKRIKLILYEKFTELENTFKKIKLQHNTDCKLNLHIVDNKLISYLVIDDDKVNAYYLDFY